MAHRIENRDRYFIRDYLKHYDITDGMISGAIRNYDYFIKAETQSSSVFTLIMTLSDDQLTVANGWRVVIPLTRLLRLIIIEIKPLARACQQYQHAYIPKGAVVLTN